MIVIFREISTQDIGLWINKIMDYLEIKPERRIKYRVSKKANNKLNNLFSNTFDPF